MKAPHSLFPITRISIPFLNWSLYCGHQWCPTNPIFPGVKLKGVTELLSKDQKVSSLSCWLSCLPLLAACHRGQQFGIWVCWTPICLLPIWTQLSEQKEGKGRGFGGMERSLSSSEQRGFRSKELGLSLPLNGGLWLPTAKLQVQISFHPALCCCGHRFSGPLSPLGSVQWKQVFSYPANLQDIQAGPATAPVSGRGKWSQALSFC